MTEQVTSLKEMHDKLNEEKKQLRAKIRECRDALQKWEKDLKYYEGAEDSVDIMLKMICDTRKSASSSRSGSTSSRRKK